MKLTLDGHDRYFAVEQSLLCYFSKEQDGEAVSRLTCGKQWQTAVTTIRTMGCKAIGLARASLDKHPDTILKTSFYRAAKQLIPPPPWGALTGIRPAKKALECMDEGKDPAKALQKRYDVTKERAELAACCARHTTELRGKIGCKDIALYIGIPFCPTRCSYCSFISADAAGQQKLIEPYVKALNEEILQTGESLKKLDLTVRCVYWGGGTPTVLSAEQLDGLLGSLTSRVDSGKLWEHCVEAGRPDTVTAEKLTVLRRHGVNRVSINPQSLQPEVLQAIGRNHSPAMFFDAFALARSAGFAAINCDLIAGLPLDTPEGFADSLRRVILLSPENITVHTLAQKKGSKAGEESMTPGSRLPVKIMLDTAAKALTAAGYEPYYLYRQKFTAGGFENVGWTRRGFGGIYNIWMMEEQGSVLALGAGGVSKFVDSASGRIERCFHCKFPLDYLSRRDKIEENQTSLVKFYENNRGASL